MNTTLWKRARLDSSPIVISKIYKYRRFEKTFSVIYPHASTTTRKAVKGSAGTTLALDGLEHKRKHPKLEMARKDFSPFLA